MTRNISDIVTMNCFLCRCFLVSNIIENERKNILGSPTKMIGDGLVVKSCPILATLWTVILQVSLSMEFPRQEHWSRLPFPSPGHLSYPGIEYSSPELQANSLLTEPPGKPINLKRPLHSLKNV